MPAAGGFPQHSSGTFWDLPFCFPFSTVLSFFLFLSFSFFFFRIWSHLVPGCALWMVWFDWKSDAAWCILAALGVFFPSRFTRAGL